MSKFGIIVSSVISFLLISAAATAAERLKIVSAAPYPYHKPNNDGFVDLLLTDTFKRSGYEISIFPGRSLRAIHNVTAGESDALLGAKYCCADLPELVRVPEVFFEGTIVAAVLNKNIKITDWADLALYKVAHLRDWKAVTSNLPPDVSAVELKRPYQMFKMLAAGRFDVVISSAELTKAWIDKLKLDVKILTPPLLEIDVFLFMNIKHKEKVGSIAASLKEIKADGTV